MTLYSQELAVSLARAYAESNMTSSVRIVRMKTLQFDDQVGTVDSIDEQEIYAGVARVYSVVGPLTMSVGDEPTRYSSTYVSIPVLVDGVAPDPQVDDLVEVLVHADPNLVGRSFRVLDVEAGGQFPAVRRMQVQGIQESTEWAHIPKEWIP